MKKPLLIVAMTIAFAGCSDEKEQVEVTAGEDEKRPLVTTTNYPLTYFAERIASPWIDVRFAVPPNEDPAYWKPGPQEVLAMQEADLILTNGASYESWLATVSLPPSRLVVTTDGLEDRLVALAEETTHSHGPEGEHEHLGTAFTTWLDLSLAVEQARTLTAALAARWPQHQEDFERQFAELAEDLEALDRDIARTVALEAELPVLFSHPVYQYLEARYGLKGRSVHWEPDQMPDDTTWQELQALLEDFPAQWMIWEGSPLPQISQRLEALGIRSAVFDPCSNVPASGDFASAMEQNLQALRVVFREGDALEPADAPSTLPPDGM